jgi:DNA-binding IclR family transcriptional regulator
MSTLSLSPAAVIRTRDRRAAERRDRLSAIDKTFVLYEALRSARGAMRLSDLSRRAGLPKSTTHRLLNSLVVSGLAVRTGAGYVATEQHGAPGPEPATEQRTLLRRLAPFAADLLARTGLTAGLAVLDGTDVVFVHRVYSHETAWTPSDDSLRDRAHRTAAGRLLLSRGVRGVRGGCEVADDWGLTEAESAELTREMLRIRHRGYAVGERAGITCLAVALPAPPGSAPVAFTVKGWTRTFDQDRALFWMRPIAHAAAEAVFRTPPLPAVRHRP